MVDVSVPGSTVTVSGGDTWSKDNHIDDNTTYGSGTAWASSQTSNTGPSLLAAPAYIGIDLGVGNVAVLDGVTITQGNSTDNSIVAVDGISFQHSDDGAGWTEHEKITPTAASIAGTEAFVFAAQTPSKRFFRFVPLANVTNPNSAWGMSEVVYDGTLNPVAGGGGNASNDRVSISIGLGL